MPTKLKSNLTPPLKKSRLALTVQDGFFLFPPMIVKSAFSKTTFDKVFDCYNALQSKEKAKDVYLASTLLACDENQNNALFEDGIHYQGCFFWFASIYMLMECLSYHADQLKLPERLSASQLKTFLAIFKDKGEKSICAEYRRLYAIKHAFQDQTTKTDELIMPAEDWCNRWFKGQKRGVGTSTKNYMIDSQFTDLEIDLTIKQLYHKDGGINLRRLIETRSNPNFHLVNEWTKASPCRWLEKLVPEDHHLSANLGKWVRFVNPNDQQAYQYFPYRLVYLQYGIGGNVDYHGENQLTLSEGIRVRPEKVTFITEEDAKIQYLNAIKEYPYDVNRWGGVVYTDLWNPKKVDFTSEFHPNLSEATWAEFSKCNEFEIVDGKKNYSVIAENSKAPLTGEADDSFATHMNYLRSLKVEEYVFHKKYNEISEDDTSALELRRRKNKIWRPKDIRNESKTVLEIEKLEPEIIHVTKEDSTLWEDWRILRVYSHSMDFDVTPARMLRFLVRDKVSGKYLGVTSIGSDVLGLGPREEYIGSIKKRSKHSCIGSCIMATQPFGYNFLGGKLVASLLTTKSVRDVWKKKYGNVLVGFTTTSLYGTNSMYNSIPWWHKCGASEGKITLNPDDEYLSPWRERLKKELGADYKKMFVKADGSPVTSAKQKLIKLVLKKLKLKPTDYAHGYQRGVYYAAVYENTKAFFAGEINELQLTINPKFSTDVKGVLDWWRPKAIDRYKRLLSEGKINDDSLFYYGIKDTPTTALSYERARAHYFTDIGR